MFKIFGFRELGPKDADNMFTDFAKPFLTSTVSSVVFSTVSSSVSSTVSSSSAPRALKSVWDVALYKSYY